MLVPRLACAGSLVLAILAGCSSAPSITGGSDAARPYLDAADGLYHYALGVEWHGNSSVLHVTWAPGALSQVTLTGHPTFMSIQADGLIRVSDDGTRLLPPAASVSVDPAVGKGATELVAGKTVRFLPTPATKRLEVVTYPSHRVLDPAADGLPLNGTRPFVSGANMIALEEYQQAHFPHRSPSQPNYAASQQYFSKYFTDLGYQVEVDPYGTDTTPVAAFANIVATKPGTGPHKDQVLFVAGGHYDMVTGTTFAAFDNTSGSVGTMELARALAPYKFDRTLKFALWGGEESGTLGSAFWIKTHPDAAAHVVDYWNLDVIGMSWPAHPQDVSPILVAAGPDLPSQANDGTTADPVSLSLLGFAKTLQTTWFGFPDTLNGTQVFRYEGVDSGERSGYAKVNSQSDHDSFTKAGIPAWFIFNGDTLHKQNPVGIHSNKDTLANMTKVALYGEDANLAADLTPDEVAKGRDLLARSFEATVDFPLYATILTDLGLYTPPGVASTLPAGIPPITTDGPRLLP